MQHPESLVFIGPRTSQREADMGREFRVRLSDVDTILHEFELRGQEYFDDTLRLPRAFDLMNKAKTKADFERQVIGRAPQEIEKKVDEIIAAFRREVLPAMKDPPPAFMERMTEALQLV